MQTYNHSATKAIPSSHYPDQHSAYQHQKSFGSVFNFLPHQKILLKEQLLNLVFFRSFVIQTSPSEGSEATAADQFNEVILISRPSEGFISNNFSEYSN